MKKHKLILVFCSSIFLGCNGGGLKNENGVRFETEKLIGTYMMDVSPLIESEFEQKAENTDSKNALNVLSKLAIKSSLFVELNFYKNNNGVMKLNTGWLGTLVGSKNENIGFTYELKNDSILCINGKENTNLTIKSFTDSFDCIEFVNRNSKERVVFNKIKK